MKAAAETRKCEKGGKHTLAPVGYLQWHAWAERKMRRHRCIRCPKCGLWAIWKRKKRGGSE